MWTIENMPDQSGKNVLVTGANTGIGYETALAFFNKGANVIMACRDVVKGKEAMLKINNGNGTGKTDLLELDLSDLTKVKLTAEKVMAKYQKLDIVVNNAGVMAPPATFTKQGFELQFGTNVLGHFTLTGYLYPLLKTTPNSRIVTVSSLIYANGQIDYSNLKMEKDYDGTREYAQSKLANILFTLELQRKIDKKGDDIKSAASHPGVTSTDLSRGMSPEEIEKMIEVYGKLMETWQGALPSLYAATSAEISGGDFIGPDQDAGLRGFPTKVEILPLATSIQDGEKFWEFAQEVTGVYFP